MGETWLIRQMQVLKNTCGTAEYHSMLRRPETKRKFIICHHSHLQIQPTSTIFVQVSNLSFIGFKLRYSSEMVLVALVNDLFGGEKVINFFLRVQYNTNNCQPSQLILPVFEKSDELMAKSPLSSSTFSSLKYICHLLQAVSVASFPLIYDTERC